MTCLATYWNCIEHFPAIVCFCCCHLHHALYKNRIGTHGAQLYIQSVFLLNVIVMIDSQTLLVIERGGSLEAAEDFGSKWGCVVHIIYIKKPDLSSSGSASTSFFVFRLPRWRDRSWAGRLSVFTAISHFAWCLVAGEVVDSVVNANSCMMML